MEINIIHFYILSFIYYDNLQYFNVEVGTTKYFS